jgi:hypothetical protein
MKHDKSIPSALMRLIFLEDFIEDMFMGYLHAKPHIYITNGLTVNAMRQRDEYRVLTADMLF